MPTVTVLAWCLIASTCRVSSSMPSVSPACVAPPGPPAGVAASGGAALAFGGDPDRRRPVAPAARARLGPLVGGRTLQLCRAHQHERLGREIDVLLVFGRLQRDRLVTELGCLHPPL